MKKSQLNKLIREEVSKALKEELSLKAGESVIYQGRKAIFKRHGHPGKTAHIEVDDEYIEVPVSKLKKDPDYDYTKASPHAIKKLEEERYGSSRGLDMGNGVDEEDNAYNIAVTIANNIDKYNISPTSLGTGVAYVLKEKYGKQYSKSLVDALQKELNRKPHPPQDPSEL